MTDELRCAIRTEARGDSPTGTANAARTHVLVEMALPWPADLGERPEHHEAAAAAGPGARIHGVVPSDDTAGDRVRVVVHTAGAGPFTAYRRSRATVARAELGEAVAALVSDGTPEEGTDVLVCGHGSRDRCCGSMGTALARQAVGAVPATVWRTGHLGGHRFAPTALVLPSGTTWAWLDDDLLTAIVERSRPPAELVEHYRGSTAVDDPAAQVVEARVLAEVGWSWLDGPRTVEVVGQPEAGRVWSVRATGAGRTWEATVEKVGERRQLVCGQEDPGPKVDPQLRIVALDELGSASPDLS